MSSDLETKLIRAMPSLLAWIEETLERFAKKVKPVSELGYSRFNSYFSRSTLLLAGCVVTKELPTPPLTEMGLPELSDFEKAPYNAVTYKNVYFVHPDRAATEFTHFHELVHVVQWAHLGTEKFLGLYASELVRNGYRQNVLERMAYDHQNRFIQDHRAYDAEREVRAGLDALSLK